MILQKKTKTPKRNHDLAFIFKKDFKSRFDFFQIQILLNKTRSGSSVLLRRARFLREHFTMNFSFRKGEHRGI